MLSDADDFAASSVLLGLFSQSNRHLLHEPVIELGLRDFASDLSRFRSRAKPTSLSSMYVKVLTGDLSKYPAIGGLTTPVELRHNGTQLFKRNLSSEYIELNQTHV